MTDSTTLSREELLELVKQKDNLLAAKDERIGQLEQQTQIFQQKTQQLEQERDNWKLAYEKLWHQRFAARSERYIADPRQLVLDFGESEEVIDAAEGLSLAVEEADLIPAHSRRKPRKQRDESLPAHLPRYEVTAEVPDFQKALPHAWRARTAA